MLLLRTPDKIFLKLAIDNKNVENRVRHYLVSVAESSKNDETVTVRFRTRSGSSSFSLN